METIERPEETSRVYPVERRVGRNANPWYYYWTIITGNRSEEWDLQLHTPDVAAWITPYVAVSLTKRSVGRLRREERRGAHLELKEAEDLRTKLWAALSGKG